jgi:hypothetical protein
MRLGSSADTSINYNRQGMGGVIYGKSLPAAEYKCRARGIDIFKAKSEKRKAKYLLEQRSTDQRCIGNGMKTQAIWHWHGKISFLFYILSRRDPFSLRVHAGAQHGHRSICMIRALSQKAERF